MDAIAKREVRGKGTKRTSSKYLVFGGAKDHEGGADDLWGCFDALSEAMDWAEQESGLTEYANLSSWLHIAKVNLTTNEWSIVAHLALPGTEHYDWYTDVSEFAKFQAQRRGPKIDGGEYWHWRKRKRA